MRNQLWLVAILGIAMAVTGCANKQNTAMTNADLEQQLTERASEVEQLQAQVSDLEKSTMRAEAEATATAEAAARAEKDALEAREMATKAQQASADGSTARATSGTTFAGSEMLPPNAKAGECYTRVHLPPTYKTVTEQMLKNEASESVKIIPAKFEWAEERVLVKPASKRLEVVPARYDWVEEQVLVKPASKQMVEVPAVYEWKEERVLVKDAETVWKKGRGPIERVNDSTGEIMCLVEVPAQYKTVRVKTLKSAATTKEIEIPAEYNTIKKQVLVNEPSTREIEIPAEYSTIKKQVMDSPPKEIRTAIPAEYQTLNRTQLVTEGRMEWRPILCETNMTTTTISEIQRALKNAGHDPGPIDGIYGRLTSSAVKSFQQKNGMAVGGLTLATLTKLGIRA